ncbi:MAG: outer membrane protein assembly factor BamB [Pontibacterium sp.]
MKNLSLRVAALGMAALMSGCSLFGESETSIQPDPVVFEATHKLQTKWSKTLGQGLGHKYHQFSPALVQDYVVALSKSGKVNAYQKADGKLAWEYESAEPLSSGLGASDSALAFVSRSGVLTLLSSEGEEQWSTQLDSEVISVPQLLGDLLVVQQVNGAVRAFDVQSGESLWRYDASIPNLTFRGTASPRVTLDYTFAALDNGKLVALQNANGNAVFERTLVEPRGRTDLERVVDIDGQPVVDQRVVYLASFGDTVTAIDLTDGTQLWDRKLASFYPVATALSRVFVSGDDGVVTGLDQASGADVWSQTALKHRFLSAPVLWNQFVFLSDTDGNLFALSQLDGGLAAMTQGAAQGQAAALIADDTSLYFLTQGGKLSALSLIDLQ